MTCRRGDGPKAPWALTRLSGLAPSTVNIRGLLLDDQLKYHDFLHLSVWSTLEDTPLVEAENWIDHDRTCCAFWLYSVWNRCRSIGSASRCQFHLWCEWRRQDNGFPCDCQSCPVS